MLIRILLLKSNLVILIVIVIVIFSITTNTNISASTIIITNSYGNIYSLNSTSSYTN